jgi:hypothetical protein
MVIDTLLEEDRADIIRGLITGDYTRWGGVVRVSKGNPGAGQIVGMLRETGARAEVTNPIGAPIKGMDLVVNSGGRQVTKSLVREGFSQTQQMLDQVMGLSAIGAGASVLNLGLSAAGFYVMNKKLNGLQDDVSALKRMSTQTIRKLDTLDKKLDGISRRLVELRYLAAEHGKKLDDVLEAVFSVKNALFSEQMANLKVAMRELEAVDPDQDGKRYRRHRNDISRVRLSFEGELESRQMHPRQDPRMFLDAMALFRGWALAGAFEVMLERRHRNPTEAAERAEELSDQARDWTKRWTRELLPEDEYGGAGRFGFGEFEDVIGPHVRRRVYTAYLNEEPDTGVRRQLEIDGANAVARHRPGLDQGWFDRQVELANVVDTLEETTERMESLAAETSICADKCIPYSEWEELPEPDEEDEREAQAVLAENVPA